MTRPREIDLQYLPIQKEQSLKSVILKDAWIERALFGRLCAKFARPTAEFDAGSRFRRWKTGIFGLSCWRTGRPSTTPFLTAGLSHESTILCRH
jgi:hypothetical protein